MDSLYGRSPGYCESNALSLDLEGMNMSRLTPLTLENFLRDAFMRYFDTAYWLASEDLVPTVFDNFIDLNNINEPKALIFCEHQNCSQKN